VRAKNTGGPIIYRRIREMIITPGEVEKIERKKT